MLHGRIDAARHACRAALESDTLREVATALAATGANADACAALVAQVTESHASLAGIEALRARLTEGGCALPPGSLERVLLLHASLQSLERLPSLPLADPVKRLFCDEVESFAEPAETVRPRFDGRRNVFVGLCKIASLRRFPAGQLSWEISGVPRSWLLKVARRTLPRVAWCLAVEMRGFAPAFVIHLNASRRDRFALIERESRRAFYRMAQSLALQPRIRGLVASSWLHSPDTMRVSPHLTSVNRVFLDHGAVVTTMGPADPECGVFTRSPERRRLYEEGAFRPTIGLVIWPRRRMLAWAAAHPEYAGRMSGMHVTATEVTVRFGPLGYEQKLAEAAALAARLAGRLDYGAAEALLDALRPSSDEDRRRGWALLEGLPPSECALYLQARWLAQYGDAAAAAERWRELIRATHGHGPLVLLHAARAMAADGRWTEAAARVRDALAASPDYTFFARAGALIAQVARHAPATGRRARVALLGSATTGLLAPILKALCFRDGIDAEIYEGLHGAWRQEILDPDSGLSRFAPDVVFILTSWRDLDLPWLSGDETQAVEAIAREHAQLWETLATRCRCHIVPHAFDVPAFDSAGALGGRLAGTRRHLIRRLNLRLTELAPASVSVLDTEAVIARVGMAGWYDAGLWHRARQHPSPRALPALGEAQAAALRAVLGLTRKVVVCDLDHTLWGGVIGEDGLAGIRVGPGSPEGEAFSELQQYLRELRARGILLAACSKNDPAEARRPFLEHPHMTLRLDDFSAFVANWDDKVTNLRRIAAELSLGAESFVFLDDNPVERAWVRSQMPEVAVVELPPAPASFVAALDAGAYFDVPTLSPEDLRRADLYREAAAREALRAEAGSIEAFLAGLGMQASCAPVSPETLPRVTQLVNKTNQFNLTTRRYTEAQVLAIAGRAWTGVVELEDRFGRHGIVGVLFCVPGADPRTWEIDTWLMSCRVLGRQLEAFMLDRAIEAARAQGILRLVGVYRPTPKNGLVADLYPRFGFTPCGGDGTDARFELAVETAQTPYSTFIATAPPDAGRPAPLAASHP